VTSGRRSFAVILAAVFFCGAFTFPLRSIAQDAPSTAQPPEASSLWIDVPFVKQPREGCGPASISMVMLYWNQKNPRTYPVSSDVNAIQSVLYSKREKGISGASMQKYFKQAGFDVFPFRGQWEDLGHHIAKGRPLIVGLAASGGERPLHFVVVVGVDDSHGYVYINDPDGQKLTRVSRENFLREWAVTDYWTLLPVPSSG